MTIGGPSSSQHTHAESAVRPHLRDLPIAALPDALRQAGVRNPTQLARRLAQGMYLHGALSWDELPLSRRHLDRLRRHFELKPQLSDPHVKVAEDGTRKLLLRLPTGEAIEVVLLQNARSLTLCVSSQAGCALGCTFCATGTLGLMRQLSPGQILESVLRAAQLADQRVSDVVFMGQGEPLHNFDAVMVAAANLNHVLGMGIGRRRITISTVGLTPQIRRYTREGHPYRLHLSLHAAIDATRERLMPISRVHPLGEVLEAFRAHQHERQVRWLTFQYVALPGVNMDSAHVDALVERLAGMRVILNVIPWNDIGSDVAAAEGYRAPTWAEVRRFTEDLGRLGCPIKIRYSGGKREGMGCGQLAAETLATEARGGHLDAPPGIFSDLVGFRGTSLAGGPPPERT